MSIIRNNLRTPTQARDNSGAHVLAMAEQVNAQLDQGARVFTVPTGAARMLRALLVENGWTVEIVPKETKLSNGSAQPLGTRTLLLSCALDDADPEEQAPAG